jgi:H+/gluconate symporter-like permease
MHRHGKLKFLSHIEPRAVGRHLSPDVLHRVAAIASASLDTGPHNGAIMTLLAVCGMTHRQSYPDIFVMTILKTIMVVIALAFVAIFGIA